ncbi:MAG TPA: dihydrolipoyl dehydrogenase, partial [Thermoleophilia bacterium]|nr:dihydrolipoyl dehydrogenase [Thermoleophilia bacterium]
ILGGGPGGYVAAIRAAQRGADVTCVEKDLVGGTCLNRGCIPTKALLGSVDALHKAREGDEFGFKVEGEIKPDFARMYERKDDVARKMREGVEGLFKRHKIKLVRGHGRIVAEGKVEVETEDGKETLEYDKLIIATGSEPAQLPFFDFDQPTVLDSTDALRLTELPETLLIIGAGVIGCEFAGIFSELGTKITMVEMMPQVLPLEDKRLAKQFQSIFKKRGIDIRLKTRVDGIAEYGENHITANVEGGEQITAEKMLVSIGRTPNSKDIGLEVLGIETDQRGYIAVNEKLETGAANVYCVGDVNGGIQLAHVASHEGLAAVENCLGGDVKRDLRAVPSCIYTMPEIASIGLTEDQAKDEGFKPVTGSFRMAGLGKALAIGEDQGYIQIVADEETDRVLGANMMGAHVTDLIHEIGLAIEQELEVKDIINMIHAHPTIAEGVLEAAEDVHGEAIHFFR